MKDVRITAVRKVLHQDLVAKYENPIEHACDVHEGQVWLSIGGKCPADFCPEAWKSIREYVEVLACGGGNFFDGWMKNPHSALLSCNDGFRPVSFLLETVEQELPDFSRATTCYSVRKNASLAHQLQKFPTSVRRTALSAHRC